MNDRSLTVTGGAGGLAADLEAMHRAAAVLVGTGGDLVGLSLRTAAVVVDPALVVAAPLDPVGCARVQRSLLPVAAGPTGLATCAARTTALGLAVSTAARLYAATERTTEALVSHLRDGAAELAGSAVGTAVTRFLPWTAVAASAATASWAAWRAAPLLWDEGRLVAVDAARGNLRLDSLDDRWVRFAGEHGMVLRDDVEAAGRGVTGWLVEHPELAEHAAAGVPAFLDGLTGPLVVPGDLQGDGTGDGRIWPPEDVEELAALLGALGAVSPLMVEGNVEVSPVEPGSATAVAGGSGIAGAVRRLVPYSPPLPPDGVPPRTPHTGAVAATPFEPGRVRVERVERPGGTVWSVSVPPTQTWSLTGGGVPFDGSSNVLAVGGRSTAAAQAVTEALRQAGVPSDEPVMLTGYSQGGLTAAQLASDERFRDEFSVSAVLTLGSPVGGFDVPDDVQVLSVEHEQDLTPFADGARNPDRPSWTTVRRDLTEPNAVGPALLDDLDRDPFTGHRIEYYLDTAEALDIDDPSVAAWRQAAAPFLHTADARVEVTEWQAVRVSE